MGDFEEKNQESENLITDVSSEETSNENYNNDIDVTAAEETDVSPPGIGATPNSRSGFPSLILSIAIEVLNMIPIFPFRN